jgi:hypothetical protein
MDWRLYEKRGEKGCLASPHHILMQQEALTKCGQCHALPNLQNHELNKLLSFINFPAQVFSYSNRKQMKMTD